MVPYKYKAQFERLYKVSMWLVLTLIQDIMIYVYIYMCVCVGVCMNMTKW